MAIRVNEHMGVWTATDSDWDLEASAMDPDQALFYLERAKKRTTRNAEAHWRLLEPGGKFIEKRAPSGWALPEGVDVSENIRRAGELMKAVREQARKAEIEEPDVRWWIPAVAIALLILAAYGMWTLAVLVLGALV